MATPPQPPAAYRAFVQRHPKLGQAWDLVGEAGQEGPLDARTVRLVKLAVAFGALREGAVHSGVRKALAAGTLGFPATVAIFSWVRDVLENQAPR